MVEAWNYAFWAAFIWIQFNILTLYYAVSVIPKFHTKSNKFWMCFSVFGRGFVKYFNCDELFWGEKGTGGGFGCFWVILLGSVFYN